jgi:beta-glucanase (GH16 family)
MAKNTWKLVWQDEFDGSVIDASKWRLDVGYTGESNKELEIYTDRAENVYLADGCLVIAALQENYRGFKFTSARLKTQGLHSWAYGRVEAYIKIPIGQGMWPAFWMLGDDVSTVGWPECGEIDIMENVGHRENMVRGTIHGPGYCRDDSIGKDFILPEHRFADAFHLYAIEWEPGEIRCYVDDHHYNTLTPNDVPGKWVFGHPFFILINVAVGGLWPGYPDKTTKFPQFMYVDYVRVYQKS